MHTCHFPRCLVGAGHITHHLPCSFLCKDRKDSIKGQFLASSCLLFSEVIDIISIIRALLSTYLFIL